MFRRKGCNGFVGSYLYSGLKSSQIKCAECGAIKEDDDEGWSGKKHKYCFVCTAKWNNHPEEIKVIQCAGCNAVKGDGDQGWSGRKQRYCPACSDAWNKCTVRFVK